MAKKRDVLVHIGVDDSDFTKGVKKSINSFTDMEKIGKKAGAAIAAGFVAATAAVAAMVTKGLILGDQLDDMAKRFGTTSDFLAEFGHVARMSGLQLSELEQGFTKLAKKGPLEEQLNLYAERFAALTTHTERAQLASEIFGDRVGAKLIPVLSQGAEGIEQLRAEASSLGLTLDEVQRKNIAEANDAFDRLKSAGEGVALQLAAAFGPAIEAAADAIVWLTEKVIEALPKLQAFADRFLGIKTAAEDLGDLALREVIEQQILAIDAIENRIAGLREVEKINGKNESTTLQLNEALAEQVELQTRLDKLYAERVKRQRQLEQPVDQPVESIDTEALAKEAAIATEILHGRLEAAEQIRERDLKAAEEIRERQAELLDEELQSATDRLAALLEIKEQEREAEKELVDALLIERQRYSEELAAQDEKDMLRQKAIRQQTTDNLISGLAAAFNAISNDSKKRFEQAKTFAKAEAALNAFRAIQQVWADETLPFYAKIAATAITALRTAANISAINSTTFGGGTTPSAAGTPTVNGNPVPAAAQRPSRTIRLEGLKPDKQYSGRELLERLQEAIDDGGTLVIA